MIPYLFITKRFPTFYCHIPLISEDIRDIKTDTYFQLSGTLEKPKLILEEDKTLFGKPNRLLEELIKASR